MSISFANHGHLARALSYHWTVNVALCGDKSTSVLSQVWANNLAFLQSALDSGVVPAMGLQGSNILYCNYLQNARCFGNAKIPKMQRCNGLQQDLTPCSSTITKSVERSLNHCSKGPCAVIIVIQRDNQNNCTLHRSHFVILQRKSVLLNTS